VTAGEDGRGRDGVFCRRLDRVFGEHQVVLDQAFDARHDAREPALRLRPRPGQARRDLGEGRLLHLAQHEQRPVLAAETVEQPVTARQRLARLEVRSAHRMVGQIARAGQPHAPPGPLPALVLCDAERDVDDERSQRALIAELADARE
jgi:hypothetical protein